MLVGTIVAALATVSFASLNGALPPQEFLQGLHMPLRSGQLRSSCDANTPPSCSGNSDGNLCCYESPGGLLALTQFWDYSPSTGPSDSWTIHGLWPDKCDGSYVEHCDPSRDYTDIPGLLTSQGASDTLSFMEQYWVDIHGHNEHFWEHEWSTHGTCYSTLNPSCLPDGSPQGAEAVAFFQTVVGLFQQYDLYQSLAGAGITPTTDRTYTLSELESALESAFGVKATFECSHGKNLNQIYIYFNLRGSAVDGTFTAIDAPKHGNCPSHGIRYEPKSQLE